MTKPYITPQQLAEACEMREAGKPVGEISRKLDLPEKSVDYHLRKEGAFPPGWKHKGPPPGSRATYTDSRGRTVRAFTAEEDAEILRMEARGASNCSIARALGRAPNSVRNRKIALANRAMCAEESS